MTDASKVEDRKVIAPFGMGSPRTVPMKVIVCSLSRTGTASMQEALKILGMPAYHSANMMAGRKEGLEHWTRAIDAKYGDDDDDTKAQKATALGRQAFDEILGEHMAVVDLPGSLFAPELAELYPDAKVIVLNRDVDAWFVSCRKAWPFRFSSFGIRVLTWVMYWDAKVLAIRTYLLKLHSAAWRFEWPDDDAETKAKKFFHDYYDECRERIPTDRRMEFSVQEGWAPLCRYLNVEVPTVRSPDTGEVVEIPFPRSNDAASFQKYQNNTFSSIVKGAIYGWIGRLSFVAAIGQAAYLSRGSWLPAVYFLQNQVRRVE